MRYGYNDIFIKRRAWQMFGCDLKIINNICGKKRFTFIYQFISDYYDKFIKAIK